jgi:SNF2 family DNA or RNA helicase
MAFSAYDRQMGRSKKHLIVVPNSVLANWYMESKKFYGNHNDVMFVGFEPKYNKDGGIVQEPIMDENGQPQANKYTGQIEYQDVLEKEEKPEWFAKMHKIPASSVGVVIMTEEKFALIPMREESRMKYAEKWVEKNLISNALKNQIMAGTDKDDSEAKQADGGKSYNDAKNQERLENQYSDDGTIKAGELPYFEDMGFDRVIVDESHRFKNSFGVGADSQKLAYLPNPASARRARDLAMKAAWLRDKYDGKGPIMLTATPVANSPIEIFNMLTLVIDPAEFERIGIYTPDDFIRQFGIIQMVDKMRVSGEIKSTEGLAGFKNLNALRGMFHRYANMKNAGDVDPDGNVLKLPDALEMKDIAEMTPHQQALYNELRKEAKDSANPQNIKKGLARPMFAVIRDMDRVTTDPDMYYKTITFLFNAADEGKVKALIDDLPGSLSKKVSDEESGESAELKIEKTTEYSIDNNTLTYAAPELYEDAVMARIKRFKIDYVNHPLQPKYAKLVANMQSELDGRGKQIVFTEEKSQHGKLLRIIVNHLPVSEEQVAIINADTAAGEKLQQISDAFNRGDVRIIIANKKAEVGVNLQKGTSAIHHMTLPWNPASIQQRNGRGVRQGNTVSQVRVYYYQAKGSFDEYRLDLLKNKGNWIATLMDKNNVNDSAENSEANSAGDLAALLADDKEKFLAKMAEQKAKRDVEEKERRDKSAKVKLLQLSNTAFKLEHHDAMKQKAVDDLAEKVVKAQKAFDTVVADKEATEEDKTRVRNALAALKMRASKLDAEWDKKKAENEAILRQNQAFLRGQAQKGQLPFPVDVVDNPTQALFTRAQVLIHVGGWYAENPDSTTIYKVTAVYFGTRTFDVINVFTDKSLTGLQVDRFEKWAEITPFVQDEIDLRKVLDKDWYYSNLGEIGKDVFLKYRAQLRIYGRALVRDENGHLEFSHASSGNANVVYPDKNDAALTGEIKVIYQANKLGLPNDSALSQYDYSSFLPAFFGNNWQSVVEEGLKRASTEEIRAFAAGKARELIDLSPTGTVEDALQVKRALGSYGRIKEDVQKAVENWLRQGEYINLNDATTVVNDVLSNESAALDEKIRQLKAEEERAKNEALKDDPNYREVPSDIAAAFQKISIDVWYNTETVETEPGKFHKTFKPFEKLFIHDKYGKGGKVFAVKEMLKNRYDASFCGSVIRGDRKHSNTWHVPSKTDLDELFKFIA